MVGLVDTHRYYLLAIKDGRIVRSKTLVEEPEGFEQMELGTELQDEGRYFEPRFPRQFTFMETGKNFIEEVIDQYGISADVRLLVDVKRDVLPEDWYTLLNLGVDLTTVEYNEERQNETVSFDVFQNALIKNLLSRWKDKVDITQFTTNRNTDTDLPFKKICLPARRIFRRSILATKEFQSINSFDPLDNAGGSAMAIPLLEKVINSDATNINTVGSTSYLPVSSGNYADAPNRLNSMFFLTSDRPNRTLSVDIDLVVSFGSLFPPTINRFQLYLDIVKYSDGLDFKYVSNDRFFSVFYDSQNDVRKDGLGKSTFEVLEDRPFIDTLPLNSFDKYVRIRYSTVITDLLEGESLALAIINPDNRDGSYFLRSAELTINEDSDFPETTADGLRVYDLFAALCKYYGYKFESSIFGPTGKHWDLFLMHGTWIRNVPQLIPIKAGEVRRVQSNVSLKELYEACFILAPLRFDSPRFDTFYVGEELETQKNYISISLRDPDGELMEAADKSRTILGDNFFGTIELGSNKSGENYGEVNNLFSVCGKAAWTTMNDKSESEYRYVTDYRTGSEDIELQRQVQYNEQSDKDQERDKDWFFIDCKPQIKDVIFQGNVVRCEFVPKLWDSFFDQLPTNVFSPETVYNWIFRPSNLLFAHSWKIAPGVYSEQNGRIRFISSNCNSSVRCQEIGWPELGEDDEIVYNTGGADRFLRPTVKLYEMGFRVALYPDQLESLQGDKNGLVEFNWNGTRRVGRLLSASSDGNFTVIEAVT